MACSGPSSPSSSSHDIQRSSNVSSRTRQSSSCTSLAHVFNASSPRRDFSGPVRQPSRPGISTPPSGVRTYRSGWRSHSQSRIIGSKVSAAADADGSHTTQPGS